MQWTDFSLQLDVLDFLEDVADRFESNTQPLKRVLQGVATVQQFLAKDYSSLDPVRASVVAVLETVIEVLRGKDLFSTTPASVLVMPLVPTKFDPRQLPGVVTQRLNELFEQLNFRAPLTGEGSGGNYGVYRTAVEALYDENDSMRPEIDPNVYTGTAVLLYGAEGPLEALSTAKGLEQLLEPLVAGSLQNVDIPIPQNVKVRGVLKAPREPRDGYEVVDSGLGGRACALLTWDKRPTHILSQAFSGLEYDLSGWVLYANVDGRIGVDAALESYEISSRSLPTSLPGKMLLTLSGKKEGVYVDGLPADRDVYLGLTYQVYLESESGIQEIFPTHGDLSEQVRFRADEMAPYRKFSRGVPPDWISVQAPVELLPPVGEVIEQGITILERQIDLLKLPENQYAQAATGFLNLISVALEQLQTLVDRLTRLQDTVANLNTGLWIGTFDGIGDRAWWVEQLGELLLGNVEGRPPFDDGDELVGAVILVYQAPSLEQIEDWLDTVKLLFSGELVEGISEQAETIEELSRQIQSNLISDETEDPAELFPRQPDDGPNTPSDVKSLGLSDDPDPC